MYKYKKLFLVVVTVLYVVLSILELISYLKLDSNVFGLFYLLICAFLIFLLVPVTYNYKRHYSKERISKIIIIILMGLFASFLLSEFVNTGMSYDDGSLIMEKNIHLIKSVLKPIIYFSLILFTVIESNILKKHN